jgi:hypothetical protein
LRQALQKKWSCYFLLVGDNISAHVHIYGNSENATKKATDALKDRVCQFISGKFNVDLFQHVVKHTNVKFYRVGERKDQTDSPLSVSRPRRDRLIQNRWEQNPSTMRLLLPSLDMSMVFGKLGI